MRSDEKKLDSKPESAPSENAGGSSKVQVRKKKNGQIVVESKLDKFLQLYFKYNGNATDAAMELSGTTSRSYAAVLGSKMLSQAKDLGRVVMENQGYTFPKMIEIAGKKMESAEAKTPEWWDRLMKIAGYADFVSKNGGATPTTVNVLNVHKNLMDKYVDGTIEPDLPEEELDVE